MNERELWKWHELISHWYFDQYFYRIKISSSGRKVWKIGIFRPVSCFISKMIQETAIGTVEDE